MRAEYLDYLSKIDDNVVAKIVKDEIKKSYKKELKKNYYKELELAQIELLRLQDWVYKNGKRVVIIFEGRDAAGKGGTIKRFIEHLNPRKFRIVALPKPTKEEQGQFFYQRYFKHLPSPGEITFFDRSWYNRAIVEPLFGFCTKKQYNDFLHITPQVEQALIDDGIILIKFWLDIDKETQKKRFNERERNPLKNWKLSPIDLKAQELWNETTKYQERMFKETSTTISPWILIDSNNQKLARLEAIKYILSTIDYDNKGQTLKNIDYDKKLVKVIY